MATSPQLQRLHQGDNLTRAEFERRYELMPDVKKAELVEGVVFMPSPVRLEHHGLPHALLARWLGDYVRGTPGFQVAVDTTLRLDEGNEFQPDLISFCLGPLPAQLNLGAGDAHESSAKVQDPPSRTASCVYGSRSCHL